MSQPNNTAEQACYYSTKVVTSNIQINGNRYNPEKKCKTGCMWLCS